MKVPFGFCLSVAALLCATAGIAPAQQDNGYDVSAGAQTTYGRMETVQSRALNLAVPVLVFLPDSYGPSQSPSKVVYLLHGKNKQPVTEEGLRQLCNPGTRLQELASEFDVIIVIPMTGNTFYLDAPLRPESRYATFCGEELPAFMDQRYNTVRSREGRILAGFSMGGYGAVSLLCRYPDTFSAALSRAGLLNPATGIEDLDWDASIGGLSDLLGNYWDHRANWHQNSCFNLINRIRDRKDIGLVIEIGREDILYKTNLSFHRRLEELGIPHIYAEYPGGHKTGPDQIRSLLTHLQYFNPTIRY